MASKDRDFRDGHLLRGTPARLLVVATGNVSNDDLLGLFTTFLDSIIAAFDESSFVELPLRDGEVDPVQVVPAQDDLIVALLRRRDALFWEQWDRWRRSVLPTRMPSSTPT